MGATAEGNLQVGGRPVRAMFFWNCVGQLGGSLSLTVPELQPALWPRTSKLDATADPAYDVLQPEGP
jgi:hypothetical protein